MASLLNPLSLLRSSPSVSASRDLTAEAQPSLSPATHDSFGSSPSEIASNSSTLLNVEAESQVFVSERLSSLLLSAGVSVGAIVAAWWIIQRLSSQVCLFLQYI